MTGKATNLKMTLIDTGEEIILPVGSDRGISQSMTPLSGAASMRRSVNGNMIVVANPLFRKYATTISADDVEAPALGRVWLGDRVRVESAAEIRERAAPGGVTELSREPVSSDAVRVFDGDGKELPFELSGWSVDAPGAAVVIYRPVLECVVTDYSWTDEELAAEASWSFSLEEK